MPFVYGFLRKARRHGWVGGRPDNELPGEPAEPDIDPPDPDGGGEEGGGDGDGIWGGPIIPDRPNLPKPPMPPPGIWPPMRPGDGWRPVDPGYGQGHPPPPAGGIGGRPPERPQPGPGDGGAEVAPPIHLPPGMVWPPLPPGVRGKFLALMLVAIPGVGMRYRYVVVDADLVPGKPDNSLPPPERQPK